MEKTAAQRALMLPEIIEVVLAADATRGWARSDWRACRSVNRAFQEAADRRILSVLTVDSGQLVGLTGNVRSMLDNEPWRHGLISHMELFVDTALDHLTWTLLAACHNIKYVIVRRGIRSHLHTHANMPLVHLPRLEDVTYVSPLPFGKDDGLSTLWKSAASIPSVRLFSLAFANPIGHRVSLDELDAGTLDLADDNPNLDLLLVRLYGPYQGNGSAFAPILSRCTNLQYLMLQTTGDDYIPDIATVIPGTVRALRARCSFATLHQILLDISDDSVLPDLAACPKLSVVARESKSVDSVAGSGDEDDDNPRVSVHELDRAIDCLKKRRLLSTHHKELDTLRQALSVHYVQENAEVPMGTQ